MTEKILELKTAQDMVESDLKRYFIDRSLLLSQ